MDCIHAAMTLLLLVPCEEGSGGLMNGAIAEALSATERLEADLESDALRRPDRTLEFFEIAPGMTVLDLFSGGGYYAEIVSRVVGDAGKVVAHNNEAYLEHAGDMVSLRYAGDRLGNVERLTAEADALKLPEASFDAALAMLTWHDFYYLDEANGWPAIDESLLVRTLCDALKPGAVLGVTDHVAAAGSEPESTAQNLHRIDPARIRQDLESGCFEFEGEIDVLRNAADDHSQPMFADGLRGRTDRVVYKFRKVSS
jgi:predicted methyltransferase